MENKNENLEINIDNNLDDNTNNQTNIDNNNDLDEDNNLSKDNDSNIKEKVDEDFLKEINSNELIEKEYITVENMKFKHRDSYISAREILEIIKLEKMQQMDVKKFISSFEYEYILNIETIRSHIGMILKKINSIEKETIEIIKKNVINSKLIESMFEELKDDRREEIFEDINDLEIDELDIVEDIKNKLKKLCYFKSFREDIDLINRLKIISENYENSKDEHINKILNEFIDLINNEYNILKDIVKLILKEYSRIKEEKNRISNENN